MSTPSLWHVDRFAQKLGSEGNAVTLLQTAEWPEPFSTSFDTDAHFWPYSIFVHGELSELQIPVKVQHGEPVGLDRSKEAVLLHYIVLEYDDHKAEGGMPAEEREAFLELLDMLPPAAPAARFAAFYWTKGGARLIYRLSRPISWERYSRAWRGLAAELHFNTGIQVDQTGREWWRCYRLPKVQRDGKPTESEPYYSLLLQEEVLDPDQLTYRSEALSWENGVEIPGEAPDRPTPQRIADLPALTTSLAKMVRKKLSGTAAFAYAYEGVQPDPGTRDAAIRQAAGVACSRLFGIHPALHPEHVYGLLLPMVEGVQSDGEALDAKLWRLVQHSWNAEVQAARAKQQVIESVTDAMHTAAVCVAKAWPADMVPSDPDELLPWAMKRLLLARRSTVFAFDLQKGCYGLHPLSAAQVPALLRDMMPGYEGFRTEFGSLRAPQSLMSDYSTNVSQVRYSMGPSRGLHLDRDARGEIVLDIVPHAIDATLYSAAEHSIDVERWMQSMGQVNYGRLLSWLQAYPALSLGPTAALSLRGPKGAGKSLIALACARVFGHDGWVPAYSAFSDFNDHLLKSPLIVADEGLPQKFSGMRVQDSFRTMQSGMPVAIRALYTPPAPAQINWRFILTSNNNDVVRSLAGHSAIARDDTEALMQRLVHLEIPTQSCEFLARMGGRGYTNNWIEGDAILPRHILWLYQQAVANNAILLRQRFLVEGEFDPALVAMMEGGGATPEVAMLICQDINQAMRATTGTNPHVHVELSKQGLIGCWIRKMEWSRSAMPRLDNTVKASEIRRVLDRWSTGKEYRFGSATYTLIRLAEVANIARSENIEHDSLMRLLDRQQSATPQ
jgi:hypothetical protein